MAKGFKHGAGGGAGLNFKVVGNPQPENPKENTIWVNTDEKITGWNFSATEPEAPEEGMVWFALSTNSNLAFNALKKNGIQVYPISAKQYVSGAWVDKEALIFQNGVWNALEAVRFLYKNGREYEKLLLTGSSDGSVSNSNETLLFTLNTTTQASAYCSTIEKVDVSKISRLWVNIKEITNDTRLNIGATAKNTGLSWQSDFTVITLCESTGLHYVDLPSSGEYYLSLAGFGIGAIAVSEFYYE